MKGGVRGAVGYKAVAILRRDPCSYCGTIQVKPQGHKKAGKIHASIDHIHPKGHGGLNSWGNYAAACNDCNSRKGDNSLLGYLLGIDFPSRKNGHSLKHFRIDMPDLWYDPLGIMPPKERRPSVEDLRNDAEENAR